MTTQDSTTLLSISQLESARINTISNNTEIEQEWLNRATFITKPGTLFSTSVPTAGISAVLSTGMINNNNSTTTIIPQFILSAEALLIECNLLIHVQLVGMDPTISLPSQYAMKLVELIMKYSKQVFQCKTIFLLRLCWKDLQHLIPNPQETLNQLIEQILINNEFYEAVDLIVHDCQIDSLQVPECLIIEASKDKIKLKYLIDNIR
jgi:hypothetical protein